MASYIKHQLASTASLHLTWAWPYIQPRVAEWLILFLGFLPGTGVWGCMPDGVVLLLWRSPSIWVPASSTQSERHLLVDRHPLVVLLVLTPGTGHQEPPCVLCVGNTTPCIVKCLERSCCATVKWYCDDATATCRCIYVSCL